MPLFIIDIVTTPFLSAVCKLILPATPCQMTKQNMLLLSGRVASAGDCNGLDKWQRRRWQRLRSGPTLMRYHHSHKLDVIPCVCVCVCVRACVRVCVSISGVKRGILHTAVPVEAKVDTDEINSSKQRPPTLTEHITSYIILIIIL